MKESELGQNNLIEVDRAFFCDSPFQVFTCIHMVIHDEIESDIYILDSFRDAQALVEKLNKTQTFRKVTLINAEHLYKKQKSIKKRSIRSSIGTFSTYFQVERIVTRYIDKNVKYNKMYFTCNQLSFRLARFYFIKKGYDTEFVFFDEGAGSYDGHFEKVKFSDHFFRTMLFGKRSDNSNLKFYLYEPELYIDYENAKDRLIKIPKIDNKDYEKIELYNSIFDVTCSEFNKKCIFFDSLREEICFSDFALNKLDEWFGLVEEIIGPDKMYIKSHPRAFGRYPHRCEEYMTNSPMEINYMSMDVEHMCLVALLSTAVISPKLIYDKEPYVILLCNVDHNVYNPRPGLLNFYKGVKSLYKDPTRFMIPESEEELKKCLILMASKIK